MSKPVTWRVDLTEDEADLIVRALRLAQEQSQGLLATYGDKVIRFGAMLARDRCAALVAKIASVTGVENGS